MNSYQIFHHKGGETLDGLDERITNLLDLHKYAECCMELLKASYLFMLSSILSPPMDKSQKRAHLHMPCSWTELNFKTGKSLNTHRKWPNLKCGKFHAIIGCLALNTSSDGKQYSRYSLVHMIPNKCPA